MSTKATQANREVAVTSKLGRDGLLFRAMHGREELGRLFEFRLQLLSENPNIGAGTLLGTDMSTRLAAANDSTREFNGVVSQFSVVDYRPEDRLTCYEAVVRPHLWLLTRSSHCRFFYKKTVREIVKELLDEGKVDYEDKCTASYPKLDNCVQFCETDFDFFSRLLEREGIYYYFVHDGGKDKLVLGDSTTSYATVSNYAEISFNPWMTEGEPALTECIYRWKSHATVTPTMSQLNAFDFRSANNSDNQGLIARATVRDGNRSHVTEDYTTLYTTEADGRRYAQARADAHHVQAAHVQGCSSSRGIFPGAVFKLTGHPRDDQNSHYLVTEAAYAVESDYYTAVDKVGERPHRVFDCSFSAIPKANTFRLQQLTPKPRVGLQTARVVAPGSDGIETDRYGEIKVQFHWEQFNPPKQGEQTQRCWVRVAQNWAGKGWGTMFLPRVGQEVVVAFLDDDIDYPVIVGSVYNSDNSPPYTMPANGAVSTIRTASVGDGTKDRNELRFNDKNLQMLMYTGGRFDSYVKKDAYTWVGKDKHLIVEGRELVKVGSRHLTVSENQVVKVDGRVSLKANGTISHEGGNIAHKAEVNYVVDSGAVMHLKAGTELVIEAGAMLTLKSGPSFIALNAAGVQISGPIVGLNSGGSAGGAVQGPAEQPVRPVMPKKADDGSSVK
ncbi:type VI secretion system Vgr family protein [Burkholderia cepacia]|nr:type VI secretion system Vgr family protein [Burkholderia cepacia]KVA51574.1 type VI secretion system Vgr family protein [Burkholderia cepacia]KVA70838.1 type VI secretion system Vgr family protein [Burkholderia cepacia]KVA78898.1 type VI secretion system Vgr family protein [Burkholderia cepacia]KVA78920.1 type VI secretion system Vgr family protein [Burkholderia cepacia]